MVYQTTQRRILLDYLRQNSERAFTIEELLACLRQEAPGGKAPAESTVYRVMSALVQEGQVKRFVQGNSRHFVYQMVCGEHCDRHIHLKCSRCGSLIHTQEDDTNAFLREILEKYHFAVDERATVLFGLCDQCQKKGA